MAVGFRALPGFSEWQQQQPAPLSPSVVIRGENSRKDYLPRLAAISVIQQHTKKWIEWRTVQKRMDAVVCLQSVIRGWLTCCNYRGNLRFLGIETMKDMRKLDWRNQEEKLSVVKMLEERA